MDTWFSKQLIDWYTVNKRDLPWRSEKDPYKIWLSEIILQQTQVVQGLSYYNRFIHRFPTVTHLAMAKEDEVLKLWQGLGYYSRARNLHASAKHIQLALHAQFPSTYSEIKTLKGVGDYTAAAIASFAYDLPFAVVDGNVYRVLSRIFGIEIPIDTSRGKKEFQYLAGQLLDKKRPALHNQAIMEFGALYCRPANPNCQSCIFSKRCHALQTRMVDKLPTKEKKTKVRNRFFNYLLLVDKEHKILLNRRPKGDIWQGLYEFTLIESKTEVSMKQLLNSKKYAANLPKNPSIIYMSKKYKHVLSHQHLYSRFYVMRLKQRHSDEQITCGINQLEEFAFPRLIEKYLNDCDLRELI